MTRGTTSISVKRQLRATNIAFPCNGGKPGMAYWEFQPAAPGMKSLPAPLASFHLTKLS